MREAAGGMGSSQTPARGRTTPTPFTALETVAVSKVEVHPYDVHARETRRRHSVVSPAVDVVVARMGAWGYVAAGRFALESRQGERSGRISPRWVRLENRPGALVRRQSRA